MVWVCGDVEVAFMVGDGVIVGVANNIPVEAGSAVSVAVAVGAGVLGLARIPVEVGIGRRITAIMFAIRSWYSSGASFRSLNISLMIPIPMAGIALSVISVL